MNDKRLVQFLIDQSGSPAFAALALGGIETKRMFNWRRRGIPFEYRPTFFKVANQHGANLPESWLYKLKPKRRKPNGRESPSKRAQKAFGKPQAKASKRQGPQQPGRAA